MEDIVDASGNKVVVQKHKNMTAKELKREVKILEKQIKDDKKKNTLTEDFKWQMEDRLTELRTQLEGLK